MVPWLITELTPSPAPPPGGEGFLKFRVPARKSALERLSVEATKPGTFILAPCPTSIPAGLMRNTRPFDVSVPSSEEGSAPMTRFNTELLEDCWMKRVVSLLPMEKPCQLIIALGVLVTVKRLPLWLMLAVPLTTCAPTGLAWALRLKQQARVRTRGLKRSRLFDLVMLPAS